jgi:WD40 repeat protein
LVISRFTPTAGRTVPNEGEPAVPGQGAREPVEARPRQREDAPDWPPVPAEARGDWPAEQVAVLGESRQRHWGRVYQVALSADGKWVASSGDDGVRLWDARTMEHRQLIALPQRQGMNNGVAFSPDSRRLAAGTELWELTASQPTRGASLNRPALRVAFSADGRTLAFGNESEVGLWDLTAPDDKKWIPLTTQPLSVQGLAMGRAGNLVAAASAERGKPITVWGLKEGKWFERPPLGLPRTTLVLQVALSPDGALLVAACEDEGEGSLRVWRLAQPQPALQDTLREPRGGFSSVAFAPDGQTMAATCLVGGLIRLWSVSGDAVTPRGVLDSFSVPHSPAAVAFSSDGETLASGGADGTVRLFDLAAHPPRELFPLSGVSGPVEALAFSPQGTLLAAANRNDVRLWDLTGSPPRERAGVLKSPAPDGREFVAFSPDGTRLLTDRVLWNPSDRQEPVTEHGGLFGAFHPKGSLIAVTPSWNGLQLFEVSGGPLTARDKAAVPCQRIQSLAFSADGKALFVGSGEGSLHPYEVIGGELRQRPVILSAHRGQIWAIAFTADGQTMATGGHGGQVKLWRLDGPQPRQSKALQSPQAVNSLVFSPGGKVLAATGGRRVVLCEHASGKKLRNWEFPGEVTQSAFSPDGRFLATGNHNGTVCLFRLEGLGPP